MVTRQDSSTGSIDSLPPSDNKTSSNSSSSRGRDIWSLVKDDRDRERKTGDKGNNNEEGFETTIVFCGGKNAGKSTLVYRLLDRDEQPSSTVALEYTFGRRTRGVNATKDVVHIWELAGGALLSDILDVPVNETNIHTCTYVITVDLSDPISLLSTLDHFLTRITNHTNTILENLEKRGSKRPKSLKAYAWKKFGLDHADKDLVRPSAVPIVIIGTKYDVFRDMESEKRKLVTKVLRYLAHTYGCSLTFTSTKDETLMMKTRGLLTHYAFRTSAPKTTIDDHNKPLHILPGTDSFATIGLPPSEARGNTGGNKGNVSGLASWKKDYEVYFPGSSNSIIVNTGSGNVNADLAKYPEPLVDSMRAQKDHDLERLRKQKEREMKDKEMFGKDFKAGNAYSRARAAGMASS